MRAIALKAILLALLSACFAGSSAGAANLVPDASFESPLPAWFAEAGKGFYFASKETVAGASEGRRVLAIEGWDKPGSRVLSEPFALGGDTYSAAASVRSFNAIAGSTLELALFDEKGVAKLATFGTLQLEGKATWTQIQANAVKLMQPATQGRLGLVLSGPQRGARVEVDQVGFFQAATAAPVADNSDFSWFEAEAMADGKVWKAIDHYFGWYADLPGGMKML